jgi:protein SCO1
MRQLVKDESALGAWPPTGNEKTPLCGFKITYRKGATPSFHGTEITPADTAPDFRLTDQHGQTFQLSANRGKVVLLFFGFTHCPDVCPMTMMNLRKVYDGLGDDASKVAFVYITVDPKRDNQDTLKGYVDNYNASFLALGGTETELENIYKAYGIYSETDQNQKTGGYLINHTNSILLIDMTGRWRLNFPFGLAVGDIIHDIREVLRG